MSIETIIFFTLLVLWSFYATYWITFKILPAFSKPAPQAHAPQPKKHTADHARPQHSSHDGFRAYARGGELTVEDIVKALSREG
jgi:hypothetical protein